MERLGSIVSAPPEISNKKMAGMSKGIPVHPPIFEAKAANLNLQQISAKLAEVLPLDKITLKSLIMNNIRTQNIFSGNASKMCQLTSGHSHKMVDVFL
jgi:hypothetical protein